MSMIFGEILALKQPKYIQNIYLCATKTTSKTKSKLHGKFLETSFLVKPTESKACAAFTT